MKGQGSGGTKKNGQMTFNFSACTHTHTSTTSNTKHPRPQSPLYPSVPSPSPPLCVLAFLFFLPLPPPPPPSLSALFPFLISYQCLRFSFSPCQCPQFFFFILTGFFFPFLLPISVPLLPSSLPILVLLNLSLPSSH